MITGLVAAVIASTVTGLPAGPLPGIALGSQPLLLVERTLTFFAAWMVLLVVVVQALRGHLPTEISGRGVRYADATATKARTEEAVRRHDVEIHRLRLAILKQDSFDALDSKG